MGLCPVPGTLICWEAVFFPVATVSSTIVFHSPQAGQRPIHFGLSLPHALQNHTVFVLTVAIAYFFMQHESLTEVLSQPLHLCSAFLSQLSFLSHFAHFSSEQPSFLSQLSFLSQPAHFSSEHLVASDWQPSASPHESFLSQLAHCSVEHFAALSELLLHAHDTTANIAAAIIREIKIFFIILFVK
jgi:hypothetical protein